MSFCCIDLYTRTGWAVWMHTACKAHSLSLPAGCKSCAGLWVLAQQWQGACGSRKGTVMYSTLLFIPSSVQWKFPVPFAVACWRRVIVQFLFPLALLPKFFCFGSLLRSDLGVWYLFICTESHRCLHFLDRTGCAIYHREKWNLGLLVHTGAPEIQQF